mmetsp:Transcript_3594/g.12260  ORF Transcript_3594/g.12260 Transcript_3594/m.12260 type:complete len:256 (-) Transcript_3594:384-1151(-)
MNVASWSSWTSAPAPVARVSSAKVRAVLSPPSPSDPSDPPSLARAAASAADRCHPNALSIGALPVKSTIVRTSPNRRSSATSISGVGYKRARSTWRAHAAPPRASAEILRTASRVASPTTPPLAHVAPPAMRATSSHSLIGHRSAPRDPYARRACVSAGLQRMTDRPPRAFSRRATSNTGRMTSTEPSMRSCRRMPSMTWYPVMTRTPGSTTCAGVSFIVDSANNTCFGVPRMSNASAFCARTMPSNSRNSRALS